MGMLLRHHDLGPKKETVKKPTVKPETKTEEGKEVTTESTEDKPRRGRRRKSE